MCGRPPDRGHIDPLHPVVLQPPLDSLCANWRKQTPGKQRHDRHSDNKRCKQRDHDRQRERPEETARDTCEKSDGQENRDRRKRRRQDRGRDLARPCVCSDERTLALGDMAADVFEDDDRVIDHASDGDHHPAEGQDVQGDPLLPQCDQRHQQREWNGDCRDHSGTCAAQENEDHEDCEYSTEQSLAKDVGDRHGDGSRLILNPLEVDAVSDRRLDSRKRVPNFVGNRHRVGVRTFHDAQPDAQLAVRSRDRVGRH